MSDVEVVDTKAPWQSKTNWVALVVASSAFFPEVQSFIAANPETFAVGLSVVFAILRQVSQSKISIS